RRRHVLLLPLGRRKYRLGACLRSISHTPIFRGKNALVAAELIGCGNAAKMPSVNRRRRQMSQALAGIRVIDFTHDQAGPACTQMLAWLGADVIKIENPTGGDRARRLWNSDNPEVDSFFFLLLNSNKRTTVIDLKSADGKQIVRRLIKQADVVAENLGPGVMDRLGLGWDAVKELNPRAAFPSVQGFGADGPY